MSVILTIALLLLTPSDSSDFGLTLVAVLGLIGMQAVYWLFTHPVNKFWVDGETLDRFSSSFFSFGTNRSPSKDKTDPPTWTQLRDRRKHSHIARVGLVLLSLMALIIVISSNQ